MALSPSSSRFTQTQADALYPALSLADAKGDLLAAPAADSLARLAVGTNGYPLVADSAASAGLAYKNFGWTLVVKALDESIASSTTLQDDDELFFTAASGSAYEVEIAIVYGSPAGAGTPDIKIGIGEDATVRGMVNARGISTTEAASAQSALSTLAAMSFGTAAANRLITVRGNHVGGGGTFKLQWAQDTSNASATIVRAGSVLRYRLIV